MRDRHVGDLDAILIRIESHVVANPHLRHDNADLRRHALPHALNAFKQVPPTFRIGKANQPHADLHFHGVDVEKIFDAFFGFRFLLFRFNGILRLFTNFRLSDHPRHAQAGGAHYDQRHPRQIGRHQHRQESRGNGQRLRPREKLIHEFLRQVAAFARTSHEQTRGERNQERGDLTNQAVANRKTSEHRGGIGHGHAIFHHANNQTTEHVDHSDDDARDRVTPHELAGTIHCPEKVGLLCDFATAALGFAFVDNPSIQVGIDRHLLARHAIQGKTRSHLTDTGGSFGNHHELDHDDDNEDDRADDEIPLARHEIRKRRDHPPRGILAIHSGARQNQPRCRDVEHQPSERGREQHRRENAELERRFHVNRRE